MRKQTETQAIARLLTVIWKTIQRMCCHINEEGKQNLRVKAVRLQSYRINVSSLRPSSELIRAKALSISFVSFLLVILYPWSWPSSSRSILSFFLWIMAIAYISRGRGSTSRRCKFDTLSIICATSLLEAILQEFANVFVVWFLLVFKWANILKISLDFHYKS